MKVSVSRIRPDVPLPEFHTAGSIGFDFSAAEEVTITPGEIAMIPTGLILETPSGFALIIASRSSAPKKFGITPPHGIGIIDQDYSGPEDEIKILVRNFRDEPITIAKGTRIAQGVFVRAEQAEFIETDFSHKESRGGFGSTGH
ncbi:dUTP diphosphatase [Candidatus Peregrinibacteria bacterium]|nr:MAG: dUTP diphosphatase [Candidatus Peregrinibacteria bacterium]